MEAVTMKVNFTKKQYKTLLDLVYMGEWTVNSSSTYEDRNKASEEMFQYICSFAKAFGYENLVQFDQEFQTYFPTQDYEDEMHQVIKSNDEIVFWDMLANELAKRDANQERNIPFEDDARVKRFFELENRYEEEFIEYGVANLFLKKD